jgi:hypothetical protein
MPKVRIASIESVVMIGRRMKISARFIFPYPAQRA